MHLTSAGRVTIAWPVLAARHRLWPGRDRIGAVPEHADGRAVTRCRGQSGAGRRSRTPAPGPRARRRRGSRHRPHRPAALVRRASHPDRLPRRHQHGRPRRRRVRRRSQPGSDRGADEGGGLGPHVPGRLSVQVQDVPPEGGCPRLSGPAGLRSEGRLQAAERPQRRAADRIAARFDRVAVLRRADVRRPADAVPLCRHRHPCRRAGRPRFRFVRPRAARHDVDSRGLHTRSCSTIACWWMAAP